MKKFLAFFSLLLLLSVGLIGYLHISLLNEKDQVTYKDTVLYGDASMAEGLTVGCNTEYDQKLFWNTTYTAGATPSTVTDYRFHTKDQDQYYEFSEGITLESYENSYYATNLTEDDPLYNLPVIYHHLYHETKEGECKSETIYLKDYFDFYPIDGSVSLPRSGFSWEHYVRNDLPDDLLEQVAAFEDYFKIPVLEEHSILVEVDKRYGNGYSNGSYETGSDTFYLSSFSVIDDNYVYFTFNPHTSKGNVVDTSYIKGGYGIYRFPYYEVPHALTDMYEANFKELETVYPLSLEEDIHYMSISEDKTKILLFGADSQNAGTKITVIDTKTMKKVQEIHIDGVEKADGSTEILCVYDIFSYEDFMVLHCSSEYLVVLTLTADGQYQLEYVIFIPAEYNSINESIVYNFHSKNNFAWNGSELALVQPLDIERNYTYYQSPGFQMSIFDKNGLKYFSTHDSSLNIGYSDEFWRPVQLQQVKEPALTIRWD